MVSKVSTRTTLQYINTKEGNYNHYVIVADFYYQHYMRLVTANYSIRTPDNMETLFDCRRQVHKINTYITISQIVGKSHQLGITSLLQQTF